MQNGLQLSPHKSEALIVGTSYQLRQVSPAVPSVTVAGVDLLMVEQMKVFGVVRAGKKLGFVEKVVGF